MIHDRQPTVSEIIAELRNPTDEIGMCHVVRDGRRVRFAQPLEIWIRAIGAWIRVDGSHGGFALNGMRDYRGVKALRLRRAIRDWMYRNPQETGYYNK